MKENTSWGAVADWYDEVLADPDSYQKQVVLPNILRILGPKQGMTVLDIACGQGYFSRVFADNGATVTGCDISKELIEMAQKQENANKQIKFFVSPSDKLTFADDKSFDAAVIVLALQNIENMSKTLDECARILKSGGRLILVLNHPAFRIPKSSSWQWSENEERNEACLPGRQGKMFRRIDSYMSDQSLKMDMTPGETDAQKKVFTVTFHRPLQSYFKALGKSGFAVTRLEEWISHKKSQKGPRSAEEDRMRKQIPLFLCLEATKDSLRVLEEI